MAELRDFGTLRRSTQRAVRAQLVQAARDGLAEGWLPHEHDVIHAAGRRLLLTVGPATAAKVMTEALREEE